MLQNVYEYQNDGLVLICDDLNSRCGDSEDFISGVDCIPMRQVVDYKSNAYGDHLIQFLIDCNMCMLNGRNYICNDCTSISTKGHSVVDYCLVNHDNLQHEFNWYWNMYIQKYTRPFCNMLEGEYWYQIALSQRCSPYP